MTEDSLQIEVAQYLDRITPWWWHTPNEAMGSVQHHAKRKRMGVKKGVVDVVSAYLMLAIEHKKDDKKQPTPEQWAWLKHFESLGWVTGVSYSFETSKALIDEAVIRSEVFRACFRALQNCQKCQHRIEGANKVYVMCSISGHMHSRVWVCEGYKEGKCKA